MRAALILALLALAGCQRVSLPPPSADQVAQASPNVKLIARTPEGCRVYRTGGLYDDTVVICPAYGGYSVGVSR